MPDLGVWEILIIAVVVLVLFGSKKLPDSARSLGRSLRIFKSETKGLMDEDQPKQAAQEAKLRDDAAKLREQAAALEAQAQGQPGLPAGDGAIKGVPVPKADQANRTS